MQTVLLVSADRKTQFLVATGDRNITEQLVGHIEIAMRRAPSKPPLPSIRVLELEVIRGWVQDISVLEVSTAEPLGPLIMLSPHFPLQLTPDLALCFKCRIIHFLAHGLDSPLEDEPGVQKVFLSKNEVMEKVKNICQLSSL